MNATLADMQAELTTRWAKASAYLDAGRPMTEAFIKSLANYWASMEVFTAVENSWRRAGNTGCISGKCAESVVSCRACVPDEPTGQPVKESHVGRSKDSTLWRVDSLAF